MNNKRPLFERNTGMYPTPGTPKLDAFLNPRGNPLDPVIPTDPSVVEKIKNTYQDPIPVLLPRTAHAPEGSRTIDFRKFATVPATTVNQLLFSYTAKPGATTVFFEYALFLGGGGAGLPNAEWIPRIDGRRVLQFHGDPSLPTNPMNVSTAMGGTTPEMIPCQILMEPNQVFTWSLTNNTGAAIIMGVRFRGYLDMSQMRTSVKFGD